MNNLISKIVGVCLGLSLATGVAVGVGAGNQEVKKANAATSTYLWQPTAKLSDGTRTVDTVEWNIGTTNFQAYSSDYQGVQIGTKSSVADLVCNTTSSFSYSSKTLIKRVTLYANTGGSATVTVKIGSNTVINGASVTKKSGITSYTAASKHEYTSSSGVTGAIEFTIHGTSKACYFCAIEVEVDTSGGSATLTSIDAALTNQTKVWKKGETVTATDVTVTAHYNGASDETITNGVGVTITNGTLAAGNNTVTVSYGGKSATISVYGKAPTSLTISPNNGTTTNLNANGGNFVTSDITYSVAYNNGDHDYRVSFTCSTAGWTKVSDSNGVATMKFESNNTFVFTVSATDDSTVSATITYVVTGIPSIVYDRFEDDIEEGDYVFIDSSKTNVMGNTTSNSRMQNGNMPTISNDDKINSPASSIVWHIASSGSQWTIQNAANSKYLAATNSNNQATLLTDITDNAKWDISYDSTNEVYVVENYGRSAYDNRFLKNNGTYGWAAYGAGTGNYPILYKLGDARPLITLAADDVFIELGDDDVELVVTDEATGNPVTGFNVSIEDTTVAEYVNGSIHAKAKGETTATITKTPTSELRFTTLTINIRVAECTLISSFYDGTVTVTQTATADSYTFKGTVIGIEGNSYYVQDGSYGILVYGGSITPPEGMVVGSLVAVTSKIINYKGYLTETSGTVEAVLLGTGTLPVAPVVTSVSDFDAHNQSTRVTFKNLSRNDSGAKITWTSEWSSDPKTNGIATVKDSFNNTITLFVSKHLPADVGAAIVTKIESIGVDDTFDLKEGVKAINSSNGDSQLSINSADNIDILRANEDPVQHWIDSYLYMNDSRFSGQGTGLCKSQNYYLNAKANLIALGSANVTKFSSNEGNAYTAALARYNAWASACGDSSPFAGNGIVPAARMLAFNIDNNAAIFALVAISMVTMTVVGAYFFLRKKKEVK